MSNWFCYLIGDWKEHYLKKTIKGKEIEDTMRTAVKTKESSRANEEQRKFKILCIKWSIDSIP